MDYCQQQVKQQINLYWKLFRNSHESRENNENSCINNNNGTQNGLATPPRITLDTRQLYLTLFLDHLLQLPPTEWTELEENSGVSSFPAFSLNFNLPFEVVSIATQFFDPSSCTPQSATQKPNGILPKLLLLTLLKLKPEQISNHRLLDHLLKYLSNRLLDLSDIELKLILRDPQISTEFGLTTFGRNFPITLLTASAKKSMVVKENRRNISSTNDDEENSVPTTPEEDFHNKLHNGVRSSNIVDKYNRLVEQRETQKMISNNENGHNGGTNNVSVVVSSSESEIETSTVSSSREVILLLLRLLLRTITDRSVTNYCKDYHLGAVIRASLDEYATEDGDDRSVRRKWVYLRLIAVAVVESFQNGVGNSIINHQKPMELVTALQRTLNCGVQYLKAEQELAPDTPWTFLVIYLINNLQYIIDPSQSNHSELLNKFNELVSVISRQTRVLLTAQDATTRVHGLNVINLLVACHGNYKKCAEMRGNSDFRTNNWNDENTRRRRRRVKKTKTSKTLNFPSFHHQPMLGSYKRFDCIAEEILFALLPDVEESEQVEILRKMAKVGICCCSANKTNVRILWDFLRDSDSSGQLMGIVLHLLRRHVYALYFERGSNCRLCSETMNESFKLELLEFYSEAIRAVKGHRHSLTVHLLRVLAIVPFSVRMRLVVEVIWKFFCEEMKEIADLNKEAMEENISAPESIRFCLMVFSRALHGDQEMVKVFFTVESVQLIADCAKRWRKDLGLLVSEIFLRGLENLRDLTDREDLMERMLMEIVLPCVETMSWLVWFLKWRVKKAPKMVELSEDCFSLTAEKRKWNWKAEDLLEVVQLAVVQWKAIGWLMALQEEEIEEFLEEQFMTKTKVFSVILLAIVFVLDDNFDQEEEQVEEVAIDVEGICKRLDRLRVERRNSGDCDRIFLREESEIDVAKGKSKATSAAIEKDFGVDNVVLECSYHQPVPIFSFVDHDVSYETILSQFYRESDGEVSSSYSCDIFVEKRKKDGEEVKGRGNRNSVSLVETMLNTVKETTGRLINHYVVDNLRSFVGPQRDDDREGEDQEMDPELKALREEFVKVKVTAELKLRIGQLLEAAMMVFVVMQEADDFGARMLPALIELKRYILEQSVDSWNSVEHVRTVTRTLESILKVAEVRMTIGVDNAVHRVDGDQDEVEQQSFLSSMAGEGGGGGGVFSDCLSPSLFESELDEEEEEEETFGVDNVNLERETSERNDEFGMFEKSLEKFEVKRERMENSLLSEDENLMTFTTSPLNDSETGYEGDTELKISEIYSTDEETVEKVMQRKRLDSGGGGGHLHEGVCQIIMEVLFELSKKCVADPWLWTNNLNAILKHLAVVSRSLGGTEAILRGFALVLQTKDARLRELQRSVLSLVEGIETPGSLTAFMRLFTAESPPVEILLPKFYEVTVQRMVIEPVGEMQFPMRGGETTQPQILCDPAMSKIILGIRDYHKGVKLDSAFTRSALISPMNILRFKPWTNPGFTVTTWIKWKGGGGGGRINSSQGPPLDSEKLHLWSVGSNKIMLSIYFDADGRQFVEVTRPNATISKEALQRRRNGSTTSRQTPPAAKKTSSVTNLFMKTMRVEYPEYFITKLPIKLGRRLTGEKWHHFAWSVVMFPGQIVLVLTVDGGEQFTVNIPCENGLQVAKSATLSMFCVGEAGPATVLTMNCGYSITNLLLFKKSIPELQVLAELMSYGPDFTCARRCQVEQLVPNRGLVNGGGGFLVTDGTSSMTSSYQEEVPFASPYVIEMDARQVMAENLLATFSMKNGNSMLDATGQALGFVLFGGKFTVNKIKSFATNLIASGGLDVLLFLFARVVELREPCEMQALAMRMVLEAAHRNMYLFADFKRRHVSAISSVLRTTRCDKSLHMLKVILDVAFGSEVLEVVDNGMSYYRIKEGSGECRLVYPELIIQTIENFEAWIDEEGEETVIEVLLEVLLWLNVSSVPGGSYSKRQLLRENLVGAILGFCKIHVGGISSRVKLTRTMAEKLVELLGIYGPSPPGADYLDELAKLLLLIHEPSCVFISQDRVNYYYLLAACPPDRSRLRLGRTAERWTKGLRMIQRKRRGGVTEGVAQRSRNLSGEEIALRTRSSSGEGGEMEGVKVVQIAGGQGESGKGVVRRWIEMNVREEIKEMTTIVEGNKMASQRIRIRDVARLNRMVHNRKVAKRRRTIERRTPLYIRLGAHVRKKENKNTVADVWTHNLRRLNVVGGTTDTTEAECGASTLQKELLRLLQTYVILLPDNMVTEVLDHYVTTDLLLILANNSDGGVRSQLLRLLSAMCDRMPREKFNSLLDTHKFVHLANQLVIYPVSLDMVLTCRRWVTAAEMISSPGDDHVLLKRNVGLIFLVALLPSLVLRHESTLVGCLQLLSELYEDCARTRAFIMRRTLLIPSLVKCWSKLYAKRPFLSLYQRPGSHLLMFSYQICKSLFLSTGNGAMTSASSSGGDGGGGGAGVAPGVAVIEADSWPTIWDFLNGLDFVGTTSLAVPVRRGMRVIQAKILNGLLRQCLRRGEQAGQGTGVSEKYAMGMRKFQAMSILFIRSTSISGGSGAGVGSAQEMKVKFNQLMEKSIHFVQCKDSQYEPRAAEEDLVKTIIRLGLATRLKIGSVITWAMSPFRSVELRLFVVKCLTHLMRSKHVKTYGLNITIIRVFTKKFLGEVMNGEEEGGTGSGGAGGEVVPERSLQMVREYARYLNTDTSVDLWALLKAMSKIDEISCKVNEDNASAIERSVHKYESIAADCMDLSVGLTRRFVEAQNTERRDLINQLRTEKRHIYQWRALSSRMTHENAPFYNSRYFPNSWEMDETEGPSRVRLRLKRCFAPLPSSFLLPEFQELHRGVREDQSPLRYLVEANLSSRSSITDQVLYNFPASRIRGDAEINGDLVVTETVITFFPDSLGEYAKEEPLIIEVTNVVDIWLRRYMHQEKSVELFLNSGQTVLLMLHEASDRKTFVQYFGDKVFDPSSCKWHMFVLQQWREGQLTNFEYLTALNQLGGRSFQDLMTYPVFPWVIADYESSVLDLTKRESFRKLERPIAVQHDESRAYYEAGYEHLAQSNFGTNSYNVSHFPYHFPCHYSNSGTVLGFLIRVPPYTQMFVRYQDNHFDLADRTFFSLQHAWRLASRESTTDVKELLPEFYSLPEMFENGEGFDFGVCQGGERVNDVNLPPWSNHSARLFTLVHRQALESDVVRENLRHWIDLIFGYKQTGEEAKKATNVFHSATYPEYAQAPSDDPLFKVAYATMVRTYGQMPRQLLNQPHPESLVKVMRSAGGGQEDEEMRMINEGGEDSDDKNDVYQLPHCLSVKGLRWGKYTGSPDLPPPQRVQKWRLEEGNARRLICLEATNTVYAVPEHMNYMQGVEMDTINSVTWRNVDEVVRVKRVVSGGGSGGGGSGDNSESGNLLVSNGQLDEITCCGTHVNSGQLWLGYASGRIVVYAQQQMGVGGGGVGGGGETHPAAEKLNKMRYLQNSYLANTMSYNSAFRMFKSTGTAVVNGGRRGWSQSGGGEREKGGRKENKSENNVSKIKWSEEVTLLFHTAQVVEIRISPEFRIAVSVGVDGRAAIWDTNRLEYVRQIEPPSTTSPLVGGIPIALLAISQTMGDIVTVHRSREVEEEEAGDEDEEEERRGDRTGTTTDDESYEVTETNIDDFVRVSTTGFAGGRKTLMRLHTINAKYVNHVTVPERILCVAMSHVKEGIGVNVVATGFENGLVKLWSSWDLSFVRQIDTTVAADVIDVGYTTYQHLVVLTADGVVQVWEAQGLLGNAPKFPQVEWRR